MHGADTSLGYPYPSVHTQHRGLCSLTQLDSYISKANLGGPLPGCCMPSPSAAEGIRRQRCAQPLPIATQQENSSCESQSHSPLPSLLNARAFKLRVSCLAGVVFTLLQDILQGTEKNGNADLQQLNFWLDRRFGSSVGFSALIWFQHLPGNRFSIHLYPSAVKHFSTGRLLTHPCSDLS